MGRAEVKNLMRSGIENIQDLASIAELTALPNLEAHNAELIKGGTGKVERFATLSRITEYLLSFCII